MVAPVVIAAGISAAAGLLGGKMQADSSKAPSDPTRSAAYWYDRALQRQFAQHGVRWRVEDAKRAGLHPVYALGGQLPSASPATHVATDEGSDAMGRSFAQAGQDISRAVMASETQQERLLRLAALESQAASADADRARAEYYRSAAARARQGAVGAAPFPPMGDASGYVGGEADAIVHQGQSPNFGGAVSPLFDRRVIKPSEVKSASSNFFGAEAGASPHWKTYVYDAQGRQMIDLPAGSGPTEAYESMGENPSLLWMIVDHNMKRYGPEWLGEFYAMYPALFQGAVDTVNPARRLFRGR